MDLLSLILNNVVNILIIIGIIYGIFKWFGWYTNGGREQMYKIINTLQNKQIKKDIIKQHEELK